MKTTLVWTMILFTLSLSIGLPHTAAEDPTQWGLPEGVKARLGKGWISGNVTYSPDGTLLAVASGIGIWLYDTETLQERALLTGHTLEVWSIAFSPDGKTIASGSWDTTVRLWDVATATQTEILTGHTGAVYSVAFSPDGKTLASGSSDSTVLLWDVATATHKATLFGHTDRVSSVSFSADGLTLASGSDDTTVLLWDVATASLKGTLTGHFDVVNSVSFSLDGETLASASWDGTVLLWDVATATQKGTLDSWGESFSFSPDGKTIAAISWDNTVFLWDVATTRPIKSFTGHEGIIHTLSYSPDGNTIASGSWDGTVRLWDVATASQKGILTGHTRSSTSVFSPDGKTIASGSWNGTVHLWDVATAIPKETLTGHSGLIRSVAFSPDGKTLISGGFHDETVLLWDVATATQKGTLTGHTRAIYSVAFSPDGKTIASGSWDGTVRLWDVATATHKHTLAGHTDSVTSVSFSPDGKTIASGSWDKTVRLWDVVTATQKGILEYTRAISSVSFSPDGRTIVSGSWGEVLLWDVATATLKNTLTGHTAYVESIAISPDGKTIASGSEDSTVRLWDFATASLIKTLTGHLSHVQNVAFSPDGTTLTSADDGTVLLWDLTLYLNIAPENTAPTDDATVRLTPHTTETLFVGEQIMLNLNVTDGENIAGYQATIKFDETALHYVSSANADFLLSDTYITTPIVRGNTVTIAAASYVGDTKGDGTLATLTFEVVSQKTSTLTLTEVLFSDSDGMVTRPRLESTELIISAYLKEDVNRDGVVDIQDLMLVDADLTKMGEYATDVNEDGTVNIADLVLVAEAQSSNATAAASTLSHTKTFALSRADVEMWLEQAKQLNLTDLKSLRGLRFLEQLLLAIAPEETALLANYPNPFNPETWIPYQLAKPAKVKLTIYAADGKLIRTLTLGHQAAGVYHNRNRAAYWDGKNGAGESVASGVYLYTLTAGDFTATRKMLILK